MKSMLLGIAMLTLLSAMPDAAEANRFVAKAKLATGQTVVVSGKHYDETLGIYVAMCVLNAPGTIDADYRGEVSVLLVNHGDAPFQVTRGMRIAQLVVAPVTRGVFEERDTLSDTSRGAGGYGSTGV